MTELKDTDPMPFGKYGPDKGDSRPMQDVPASYFHWLWEKGKKSETETCPVANYILRNMETLQLDHPDGIWSKVS